MCTGDTESRRNITELRDAVGARDVSTMAIRAGMGLAHLLACASRSIHLGHLTASLWA